MQPNRELHKDYVLKAAETRDPEALVEKARLLIKGEDLEPDPKLALDILTDLEENQTHAVPGMHFLLGYLHEEGLGTPQDMALAYQFYIKGAEQDDAKCMNNLGSMYERGTGVAKDLAEAQKWYERAAELGNEDALANVERVRENSTRRRNRLLSRSGNATEWRQNTNFWRRFLQTAENNVCEADAIFKAALPVSREVNDFEIRAFLHN